MSHQTPIQSSLVPIPYREKIQVLIVDDQNLVCQLLSVALKTEPDMEIIGMANNGATALKLAKQLQPHIALVDIEMPGMSGIKITEKLLQCSPETKVIILTSNNRQEYIERAFNAGAKGYLQKNTGATELTLAIRFVHRHYLQFGQGLFSANSLSPSASQNSIAQAKQNSQQESSIQRVSPTSTGEIYQQDLADSNALATISSEEDSWSMATKDLLDALPRLWTRGLFYLIIVFTAILLPWSILAKVDETGTARGKLEPQATTVKLDAPVAATVAALKVKEGETVTAGQVVAELESDTLRAELQQLQAQHTGQQGRLAQLELMKNQLLLTLNTQQQQNQAGELEKQAQIEQARQNLAGLETLAETQKVEKLAQIEQYEQALDASKANYRLSVVTLDGANNKAVRYNQAYQDGIIPQDRLQDIQQEAAENKERLAQAVSQLAQARSRLKEEQSNYDKLTQQTASEIAQAKLRLQEQKSGYQSLLHSNQLALLKTEEQLEDLTTQIMTLRSEIEQNNSKIESLKFQLSQRVVKAPNSGIVFHLPIQGAGTVVQPGDRVVEIAQGNSPLILKAYMQPTESGFLKVGMPVKVKFDAYPFQDYGILAGEVIWISPDSKMTETEQGKQATYELKIKLEQSYLTGRNKKIPLTPGQTATAEVIIRQRRLIDLVIDPFKKLQKDGLEM
ncbi:MAG: response regulator [Pleurocapsa sp.]